MTGPLLTFTEAAQRLNVTESWLRSRVKARTVPHTRLGRFIRFTEADLDAIVAAAAEPVVGPKPWPRRLHAASP